MSVKTRNVTFAGFGTAIEESDIVSLNGILERSGGLVVCDENTRDLLRLPAGRSLCLPSGEDRKDWSGVERILEQCVDLRLDRDSVIFGLGGGVICDMAAFAASLFKRGCDLTLIPTTLLCMVDAGLGGKTGIDYRGFKNLIGTFYPARRVYVCTGLLRTLPRRELLNGVVESVKHGMIGNPGLLGYLEENRDMICSGDEDALDGLVWPSMDVKLALVPEDMYERGRRAYLNLGHTFGHALESVAGFGTVSHGEAVAWGIVRAFDLSLRLKLCDAAYRARIVKLLSMYGTIKTFAPDSGKLLHAMGQDKKRREGKHRLVLPVSEGNVAIREVAEGELIAVLEELG